MYVCTRQSKMQSKEVGSIDRSVLGEQLGVSSCCCVALIERCVAADYGFYGAILFFSISDAGRSYSRAISTGQCDTDHRR